MSERVPTTSFELAVDLGLVEAEPSELRTSYDATLATRKRDEAGIEICGDVHNDHSGQSVRG